MAELSIHIATHHFACRNLTPRARAAVEGFARKNIQYGLERVPGGRFVRTGLRVFAASTADRREFRFHINQLQEFEEYLKVNFLQGHLIQWINLPEPKARSVTLAVKEGWVPRPDDQVPAISYLTSKNAPRSKLVAMQTGKGKSFCALQAISTIGVLPVIIVKPMYLDKWIIDIRKTYEIEIEELMVVRGSAQLQALLMMAKSGDIGDVKMVLVSNKTIQNWIKLYEQLGEETLSLGYDCLPGEFFQTLQAGYRLIDEVHQDFHLNFKIDLYSNVEWSASLSATLVADDDFLNKMYDVAYPKALRYQGAAYDRYIAAKSVVYRFARPEKIRSQDPASKRYSHHVFEQFILRNDQLTSNYLALIQKCIDGSYMRNYKPGDRFIVFCASIDMCTVVTDFLKKRYAHLDIRRYVEEDPYTDLMEPDGRVTTLLSAGTAVDIDQLTTTVLTTAVRSSQSNLQGFGRLRKLKDGTTPEFLYFVCEDIPKHIIYHETKRELLEQKAVSYQTVRISEPL